MKSSVTPPVLYTYNGSSWVEANGTSTLRSNVSTLTTKQATLETNLNGLTSTVSSVTTRVTTLEDDMGTVTEDVETLESSVSTLTQTAAGLATRVSNAEGSITTLTQNVSGITTRVTNAEGKITTHTTDISGLKTRVTNAEGDISDLETSVSGITTRVSTAEGNISTITQNVSGITTRISTAEGAISTLQQTTSSLSATVSNKADKTGGSQSSFGWSLTSTGFYLYSGNNTVLSATSSGITVNGQINATSGTVGNLTINDKLFFGGNTSYYINANYNDSSYYINIPGFKVDDASGAVFSGKLSAPSGTIGGFTISTSSIYNGKTSYSSTSADGVYLGTDGIGLGKGSFYVTKAGYLYATNANISGAIYASSGNIANLHITGYLYFGDGTTNYISANYNDGNYYINLPGIRVDNSTGARLTKGIIGSATNNWTIGSNTTDASIYCGISALPSTGGMGTTSNRVYIGTNGLAVKCNSSAESTFNYTTVLRSGMALFYGDANGSSNYNRCVIVASNCIRFCNSKTVRMENVSSITSYQLAAIELGNASTYALLSGTWKSSSTIAVVSDRNMKHDIEELDSRYSVFFDALTPKRFKFDDGTSDRFHVGLIAQDVGDALESAGIGLDEFAGLIIDQDPDSDHEWALRYDEILTLCIREIKALKQRISSIEGRTQDEN